MKKSDVLRMIFQPAYQLANTFNQTTPKQSPDFVGKWEPQKEKGIAFAPTNIALCKYWGKRDQELNLPVTSSLSVALPDKGALTTLALHTQAQDQVILNGVDMPADSQFVQRLVSFLDLFRTQSQWHLQVTINMNIPVAAGLASSACGFASLTAALNDMFDWKLSKQQLSILARLGSGSAARSFWNGFVEWQAGVRADGMDSYAEPLAYEWSQLQIGILLMAETEKPLSSRVAMQRTVDTSVLYASWPKKVARDMVTLRQALQAKNIALLGGAAESNALAMHATMLSSWPPICYALPSTLAAMQQIWELRRSGLEVYFTQDAGPNLKLLFLEKDAANLASLFPNIEIIKLFE